MPAAAVRTASSRRSTRPPRGWRPAKPSNAIGNAAHRSTIPMNVAVATDAATGTAKATSPSRMPRTPPTISGPLMGGPHDTGPGTAAGRRHHPRRVRNTHPASEESSRMRFTIVVRAMVVLLVDAGLLLLLSELLAGFTLDGAGAALGTAALAGLLNSLLWPSLARLALPLSVLTLGLGALVLNALLVVVAIEVVPGASVESFWSGVVVTIGLAALTALLSALLAIEEDESWYRNVVRRQARRRGSHVESEVPGVIFLEIDGLAYDVLRRALRDGSAPALPPGVREGTHRLSGWETHWSSQTGACQAGLLHGNNHDMPAFRWWEKDRGRPIVTNHPRDAAELERRHSDGRGLLHEDGASRANILSGDATHSMLTMSTVLHRRRPIGRDYSAYFARPYAVARTFVRVLAEVARERHAQARQHRRDVQPRIHRSRTYALMRAFGAVIQLDLQIAAVVGDMLAGRPVVYTTFLAYDEVAHHSGIERADTLAVLRHVDRQLARVEAAVPG